MGQNQLTLTKVASAILILLGVFMVTCSKSRQQFLRDEGFTLRFRQLFL